MEAKQLDLRGLKCPLPALKTAKALKSMQPGERLSVLADDPLAEIDIPNLCREMADRLVETTRTSEGAVFLIERR